VRPEPVRPLAQSAAAAALTPETVLRLRRRLRCSLRNGADGRLTLFAGRRSHSFPADVRPALTALLAAGELKVGDLPGLEPADRVTLARRLVTEAVVNVTDATVAEAGTADEHAAGDRHDGPRGDAPGTRR
jgi:lysine-specific demethylase/histidyl-hydroxylase NO66